MSRSSVFAVAALAVLLASIGSLGQDLRDGSFLALPSAGPVAQVPGFELGYGFGLQIDQPFHEVGSEAMATLFFFNSSPQDAYGVGVPIGGFFFLTVRDEKERSVWRNPPSPYDSDDPCPWCPVPLPAGSFHRFDVPVPLEYQFSTTGDPDGTRLPGGLYTLEAVHPFDGPRPSGELLVGPGGDPEARVPFRIFSCSGAAGELPIRELARGPYSGYRYGDPAFYGEDLVLRTEGAALRFWEEHTSNSFPPPPPPFVDFSREMVIVTLMGLRPTAAFFTEITEVEEEACHIGVTVAEGRHKGPAAQVITNPFHMVAVPKSQKEVVFRRIVGEPCGDEGDSDAESCP